MSHDSFGVAPAGEAATRVASIDIARLVAMSLVAIQHALSAAGMKPPDLLFHQDAGQIGVAMYLSLGGYLARLRRSRPQFVWLAKRLSRIYVAYWIALSLVLLVNRWLKYKPMTLSLVISNYLGLMAWTHSGQLIGVHFWFVSIILVCYLIAVPVRVFPRLLPIIAVLVGLWLIRDGMYAGSLLAFLTGMWIGGQPGRGSIFGPLLLMLTGIALAAAVHPDFAGIAVGTATLMATRVRTALSPAASARLTVAAELSYHFYLIHGPVCLGLATYLTNSLVVILVLGTAVTIGGAVCLHAAETWVRDSSSRLMAAVRDRRAPQCPDQRF